MAPPWLRGLGGRRGVGPADGARHAVLGGQREHLVDDPDDLRLGLGALEERHRLTLQEGEADRHRLHLEGLEDGGVGVHIDGDELEATRIAPRHCAHGGDEVS